MKSYSETDIFPPSDILLLHRAEVLVAAVPNLDKEIRCHELARAVGEILGLVHTDGKYDRVDHSWLVTPSRDFAPNILDVYAVGRLPQVQLVDCHDVGIFRSHHHSYAPEADRDDIDGRMVRELVRIMKLRLVRIAGSVHA